MLYCYTLTEQHELLNTREAKAALSRASREGVSVLTAADHGMVGYLVLDRPVGWLSGITMGRPVEISSIPQVDSETGGSVTLCSGPLKRVVGRLVRTTDHHCHIEVDWPIGRLVLVRPLRELHRPPTYDLLDEAFPYDDSREAHGLSYWVGSAEDTREIPEWALERLCLVDRQLLYWLSLGMPQRQIGALYGTSQTAAYYAVHAAAKRLRGWLEVGSMVSKETFDRDTPLASEAAKDVLWAYLETGGMSLAGRLIGRNQGYVKWWLGRSLQRGWVSGETLGQLERLMALGQLARASIKGSPFNSFEWLV